MKHQFKYEELTIYGEKGEDPHTVNVEVELRCTDKGAKPNFSSIDGGDPGWPAVWEVHCIWIMNPAMASIQLTDIQFTTLFPDGQDILNNALEDAHENGDIHAGQDV